MYVGWNPYYYMAKSGILRKWADKYGINIRVQRFDYAPSLDAFVAKNIDACAMTNMEALDMPAAAGVDTTAIIVGDYSNGNDAVIVRQNLTLAQIPGKQVMLVEKTVSQYLFERAMAINGLASAAQAGAIFEHFGFGYRVCVSDESEQAGGGDVEAAGLANPQGQGCEDGFQFFADPGRDFGSSGRSHRSAQSAGWLRAEVRQGHDRRLV